MFSISDISPPPAALQISVRVLASLLIEDKFSVSASFEVMSSPKIEIKLPSISGTPKVHNNQIDIKDRQLTPNLQPPRNVSPCFSNKKLFTKEFRSNRTSGRLSSYSSATESISIQTSDSKTKKPDSGGFTNIYLILCFVLVFGVLLGLLLGSMAASASIASSLRGEYGSSKSAVETAGNTKGDKENVLTNVGSGNYGEVNLEDASSENDEVFDYDDIRANFDQPIHRI